MKHKINEKITELRKNAHLTQQQLANALNVTSAAISKWETGVSVPDINTLCALADFFHISMDTLLCYTPCPSKVVLFLHNQKGEEQARQTLLNKGMIVCGACKTLTQLMQLLSEEKNINYLIAITLSEPPIYISEKLNEIAADHQIQLLTVSTSSEDQIGYLIEILLNNFVQPNKNL